MLEYNKKMCYTTTTYEYSIVPLNPDRTQWIIVDLLNKKVIGSTVSFEEAKYQVSKHIRETCLMCGGQGYKLLACGIMDRTVHYPCEYCQ